MEEKIKDYVFSHASSLEECERFLGSFSGKEELVSIKLWAEWIQEYEESFPDNLEQVYHLYKCALSQGYDDTMWFERIDTAQELFEGGMLSLENIQEEFKVASKLIGRDFNKGFIFWKVWIGFLEEHCDGKGCAKLLSEVITLPLIGLEQLVELLPEFADEDEESLKSVLRQTIDWRNTIIPFEKSLAETASTHQYCKWRIYMIEMIKYVLSNDQTDLYVVHNIIERCLLLFDEEEVWLLYASVCSQVYDRARRHHPRSMNICIGYLHSIVSPSSALLYNELSSVLQGSFSSPEEGVLIIVNTLWIYHRKNLTESENIIQLLLKYISYCEQLSAFTLDSIASILSAIDADESIWRAHPCLYYYYLVHVSQHGDFELRQEIFTQECQKLLEGNVISNESIYPALLWRQAELCRGTDVSLTNAGKYYQLLLSSCPLPTQPSETKSSKQSKKRKRGNKNELESSQQKSNDKTTEHDDSKTLFLVNLPLDVEEKDVHEYIETHFPVQSVRVLYTSLGKSRGLAYVDLVEESDLNKAIEHLDGKEFGGRILKVKKSKPLPTKTHSSCTIFVKNLNRSISNEEMTSRLKIVFAACGKVTAVRLLENRFDHGHRGSAFVDFENSEMTTRALLKNGDTLFKQKMLVRPCRDNSAEPFNPRETAVNRKPMSNQDFKNLFKK